MSESVAGSAEAGELTERALLAAGFTREEAGELIRMHRLTRDEASVGNEVILDASSLGDLCLRSLERGAFRLTLEVESTGRRDARLRVRVLAREERPVRARLRWRPPH